MKMMNLPNSLTVGRIVAIFIFLILANIVEPDVWPHFSDSSIRQIKIFAFILATLAGLTDFFDGWAARKFNQVTDFGKLIDPLADKIFVSAIMLMMVEFHMIPAWIAIIVISREFLVTGLRMLALQSALVIPADGWGKAKTAMQMTILFIGGASWVGLFSLRYDILIFGGTPWLDMVSATFSENFRVDNGTLQLRIWFLWKLFLWGMTAVTIYSGIGYFIKFKYLFSEK
ncbi:MAG: CDP-diacylglycerol--glycerol-3-phosphate 3-phosphatidyltransferase [Lentisphaerae bacterium]|nr:CDP-diacylglycerol--glycerol-3-phosphate 3-phosphatidyltransferase [Lentisphaerota bacterium]